VCRGWQARRGPAPAYLLPCGSNCWAGACVKVSKREPSLHQRCWHEDEVRHAVTAGDGRHPLSWV